jgi:hypothetical protein
MKVFEPSKTILALVASMTMSCSFSFEVTSQKTALENQILGQYQELDDEMVLLSTVRSRQKNQKKVSEVEMARSNQRFNQDDIDELKDLRIFGEGIEGYLAILPKQYLGDGSRDQKMMNLAKQLMSEENSDRRVIWNHTIETNPNLKVSDLSSVRETYREFQKKKAKPGHFVEMSPGVWRQVVKLEEAELRP